MSNAPILMIDPHIHLWDQRNTPREATPLVKVLGWRPGLMMKVARGLFPRDLLGFFGRPEYVLSDYLWEDYAADTASRQLAGFVHVQAGWKGRGAMGPVGETRWLESLSMPLLKGIVGHADLALGAEVGQVLDAHMAASPRFKGVRYMLANHPDPGVHSFCAVENQCWSPRWRAGYEQLARRGLSFDAWLYHHQLEDLVALARDIPEVPMVLCHAGSPVGYGGCFSRSGQSGAERAEIARRWRDGMLRLAEQQHVHVKLSGFLMPVCGWRFHLGAPPSATQLADTLREQLDFIIDAFGVERCMFASNFPVDKVSSSYAALYEAYDLIVADRPEEDRRALFHDTAAAFYKIS